jgi:STE24 endopeptidase
MMAAQTSPRDAPALDANAATSAYLAQIPADKKAQSDAYFEGGYWLTLWDYLYGAGISRILLFTRLSARMRYGLGLEASDVVVFNGRQSGSPTVMMNGM